MEKSKKSIYLIAAVKAPETAAPKHKLYKTTKTKARFGVVQSTKTIKPSKATDVPRAAKNQAFF